MKTCAVSKVDLTADGRMMQLLWGAVDTGKNGCAAPELVAPVAEAVKQGPVTKQLDYLGRWIGMRFATLQCAQVRRMKWSSC